MSSKERENGAPGGMTEPENTQLKSCSLAVNLEQRKTGGRCAPAGQSER